MNELTNHQNSDNQLKELQSLWEEYKYRQDFLWRFIVQTTYAIVILLVIPYVNREIVHDLKWPIVILPFISSYLSILSFCHVKNEEDLLHQIKNEYNEQQTRLFPKIKHGGVRSSNMLTFYFTGMLVLSLWNLFFILLIWIPKVS